jgi:hypothetical protein
MIRRVLLKETPLAEFYQNPPVLRVIHANCSFLSRTPQFMAITDRTTNFTAVHQEVERRPQGNPICKLQPYLSEILKPRLSPNN